MKQGVVLVAHGSRDPEWSRPFERLALAVQKRDPSLAVALAYLEHGPSLDEALAALAARGALAIRVVPAFLGPGGHVREDLPRLVAAARQAFPALKIALDKSFGEEAGILDAIAQVIAAR
ncbi:MAG: CbiX/SirB N-terminal domain-containing protein [Betaproteobacteria bacterium]|nr:CbiX/SirB N-terminal domain-containing protein [Betaproteobacteria bacterium]